MSAPAVAWTGGRRTEPSAAEWAGVCASFLGSGFRVDLPRGEGRSDAAAYEVDRIMRLAALLGASLDLADWQRAAESHPDREVEIVGGWPRSYRGESLLWIGVLPIEDEPPISSCILLPSPRPPRPTDGLPTFSRLADEVALAHLPADCGLWSDSEGRIVTSTAGPVIAQRADGVWVTGADTRSWLGRRIAEQHGADADLRIEDLEAARSVSVVRRAQSLQRVDYRRSGSVT